MEVEELESAGELGSDETFPGLNKAHGFFSLIQRNQKARDTYHQEKEEWSKARKLEIRKEVERRRNKQSELSDSRGRRHPGIALYRPPHQRGDHAHTRQIKKYCLEVELQPQQWFTLTVQGGDEAGVVTMLSEKHQLSAPIRDALLNIMVEFREKQL